MIRQTIKASFQYIRRVTEPALRTVHLLEPARWLWNQSRRIAWKAYAVKVGVRVTFSSYINIRRGADSIRIAPCHEVYLLDMINYFGYFLVPYCQAMTATQ